MIKRGLPVPLTVTMDGAPGLIAVVEAVWPKSLRVRCWAHKARNVLDKVPKQARAEVKEYLAAIREAPTPEAGRRDVNDFVARFEKDFPSAVRSLSDDLDASLNHAGQRCYRPSGRNTAPLSSSSALSRGQPNDGSGCTSPT